jgi:hypothetical protein
MRFQRKIDRALDILASADELNMTVMTAVLRNVSSPIDSFQWAKIMFYMCVPIYHSLVQHSPRVLWLRQYDLRRKRNKSVVSQADQPAHMREQRLDELLKEMVVALGSIPFPEEAHDGIREIIRILEE